MTSQKKFVLARTARRMHKYLGLLVAAQLLVWTVTGLLMNLTDQNLASASGTRAAPTAVRFSDAAPGMKAPAQLNLEQYQLTGFGLFPLLDSWVYRLQTDSNLVLLDAYTGIPVNIDAEVARSLALASYAGAGQASAGTYLPEGLQGICAQGMPCWEFAFSDEVNTRVYIDAGEGAVIAHRNDASDLMDILLMLHFMDYLEAGHFNNPQIIVMALLALWLAITGAYMAVNILRRRRTPTGVKSYRLDPSIGHINGLLRVDFLADSVDWTC